MIDEPTGINQILLPTSIPCEQLFSSTGQIYADRRSNLLGENAEKLLFLAYNIRLLSSPYVIIIIIDLIRTNAA